MKLRLHHALTACLMIASAAGNPAGAQQAKRAVINENWQKGGAFEGYKPDQEILEKRNKYAKHFRNPNGTYTVQTGNIYHYQDAQGAWQDIDLNVAWVNRDGIGYANYTNNYKSLYPIVASRMPVQMVANDHTIFSWWANPQLTLDNGSTTQTIAPLSVVGASDRGKKVTYPYLYNGISEEFVTLKNGIENNTIVHSLTSEIAQLPVNGSIQLTQFIPLHADWKIDVRGIAKMNDFTAEDFHIAIPGTENGVFFSPVVAFDHTLTQQEALYVNYSPENKLTAAEKGQKANNVLQCSYKVKYVPGGISVTTVMPAGWLKAPGRAFPVTIDPTVTFTPSPLYSGGYYFAPMSQYYGYQRHADLYLASELGISNVNITDIEYQRMNTNGTNAVKPAKVFMRTTTATTVTGTAAWNSTTYTGGLTALYDASADFHGTTAGWKMISFTTPFTYTADNLMVMVYDAYGGSGSGKYMDYSDAFASNRQAYIRQDNTDPGDATATSAEARLAEIRITYVPAGPPNCLTAPVAPANASTTTCSGTTVLRWNKVSGATSYDVYFNSGATATTLVSTSQADTFYTATTAVGAYAWRVVPKNTSGAATSCNTFTFTTILGTAPTVTIRVSPKDTLCPRVLATFTATNTDGGAAPVYTWKKNNATVGTNSPVYTDNTLNNGDTVKVVMLSNSTGCLSTPTVTSNPIRMTILPAPSTAIVLSGPSKFCLGGAVTLTVPTGAASYQWSNSSGRIAGATSNTYVAMYTDKYTVGAVATNSCGSFGDSVKVTAFQLPVPHLTLSGTTLTADPYFATYQWYKGADPIPGATTNSYTFTTDGRYSVAVLDTNSCSGRSFVFPVSTLSVPTLTNSGYTVYPNPATGIVHINTQAPVTVALRSIDGKVVLVKSQVKEFDMTPLAAGMYMLYMTNEHGDLLGVEKVVKQAH